MPTYTTKIGNKICEHTATSSIGLRHICRQLGVSYSTATGWIYDRNHELYEKYAHAKTMQLYHIEEEILEIADDSTNDYMTIVKNGKKVVVQNRESIARSRLRIQARILILTKLAPKVRGSRNDMPVPADHNIIIKDTRPIPKQTKRKDSTKATATPAPVTSPSPSERAGVRPPSSSPKNTPKPAPVKLSENARLRAIYEEQLRSCVDNSATSQNTTLHSPMRSYTALVLAKK